MRVPAATARLRPTAPVRLGAVIVAAGGIVLAAGVQAAPPAGKSTLRHLDLRPPEAHFAGVWADAVRTGRVPGRPEPDARPAWLSGLPQDRGGGAAEFARRFRREGLPVARLWENRSALISLGLNSKGKPGLWLVQKTR